MRRSRTTLSTKSFPLNDEISVNLTFNGPANALPTVPDGRGIPLVVHYSIVAPPAHDPKYVPRYADDRIGYFITARKHFGNDVSTLPTRALHRSLESRRRPDRLHADRTRSRRRIATPCAAASSPGIPRSRRSAIRTRSSCTIRRPIRQFDPEDARYNSVRWITSDSPDFVAMSPHISDPDTGQIIRTEVVIDGESMRAVRRGYVDRVLPVLRIQRNAFLAMDLLEPPVATDGDALLGRRPDVRCEETETNQAALGMSMLIDAARTRPRPSARTYAQEFLYSTVMHEVGHTLGLRHNFQGSTAFTYAQLHDPAFTHAHGTTGSIMDYTPANIAAPGERQADYFPNRLGPVRLSGRSNTATRVCTQHSSDAELPALHAIAARSTQPGLAYGTDEDAIDPFAIDPRIQRFDLSSDPLAYRARAVPHRRRSGGAAHAAVSGRHAQLSGSAADADQRAQQRSRQHVGWRRATSAASTRRVRIAASPAASPPFQRVPRAQQTRAFDLIDRYVLSSHALNYSPQAAQRRRAGALRRRLEHGRHPARRFPDSRSRRADSGRGDQRDVQSGEHLAHRQRIAQSASPAQTMDLADLFTWTNDAIFDDLGARTIAPAHRDLQRRFADLETGDRVSAERAARRSSA